MKPNPKLEKKLPHHGDRCCCCRWPAAAAEAPPALPRPPSARSC